MLLTLTVAKDEIHWIMKHGYVTTPKEKYKPDSEDYLDYVLTSVYKATLK